jgi:hypothetical protein
MNLEPKTRAFSFRDTPVTMATAVHISTPRAQDAIFAEPEKRAAKLQMKGGFKERGEGRGKDAALGKVDLSPCREG